MKYGLYNLLRDLALEDDDETFTVRQNNLEDDESNDENSIQDEHRRVIQAPNQKVSTSLKTMKERKKRKNEPNNPAPPPDPAAEEKNKFKDDVPIEVGKLFDLQEMNEQYKKYASSSAEHKFKPFKTVNLKRLKFF